MPSPSKAKGNRFERFIVTKAKEFGLNYFGCEIDPDYADFINKNILDFNEIIQRRLP